MGNKNGLLEPFLFPMFARDSRKAAQEGAALLTERSDGKRP